LELGHGTKRGRRKRRRRLRRLRGSCLRQLFWNDRAPRVRGNVGGSGGRHHSDGSDKEGEEDVTHAADGDHDGPLLWFHRTDTPTRSSLEI
jgi:hypothetical protein